VASAATGDVGAIRDAIDTFVAMRPQGMPMVAARRSLEAMLLAHEGRLRDTATAYREAIDRFTRVGMDMFALVVGLDAVSALPASDPLVADVTTRIDAFVAGTGAVVFRRRLDARLGGPAGDAQDGRSTAARQGPASTADASLGASADALTTS
jgi:hypothetical protein